MAEKRNLPVRAPYNFVPFSNKVLLPYESERDLPGHDCPLPGGKTGEIRVTFRAETPVFVSDGNKDDPRFFRGANGKCMLPGSTVRGLLRENMQILGFGLIRPGEDLEDYRIYYRELASSRDSTGGPLKEYYRGLLDIKSLKSPEGRSYSVPQRVRSGWLRREGEEYVIRPTEGEVIRVKREDPRVQCFGRGDARVVSVGYTNAADRLKDIAPWDKAGPEMKQGALLYTGRPVGNRANHLYLFPLPDPSAQPLTISPEDLLAYQEDLENRTNSLKAYYNVRFWALPEEGEEEKPVFFVQAEGHLYFGMSRYLRVGYKHTIAQGLPEGHSSRRETCALDYPHALFGFAESSQGYPSSFRSRVSVGDFPAMGPAQEMAPVRMILGNPKPSYYPGYLLDGRTYVDDDFLLRGFKQYWLKEVQPSQVPQGKESVGTTLRPLVKGTQFTGVIRFENLTERELGLLLWCVRLEEGCFQSVGMGKPYGYGRLKVTELRLRELNGEALYGPDLSASPWVEQDAAAVDRYIEAYNQNALEIKSSGEKKKKKKTKAVREREEIRDFFFLRSVLREGDEVSYMELGEYKNQTTSLPKLADVRKSMAASGEETGKKSVPQEEQMEDWKRKLAEKFKKV